MLGSRRRRVFAGIALAAAVSAALSACGSSAGSGSSASGSGGSSDTDNTVIMQTAPGSVLPYIGYIANYEGFFKKHHVNAKFTTLTTGLSATAALSSGSLNIITADPASVGPLLAQSHAVTIILGETRMQWRVLVPQSLAGKPFAQVVKQIKVMGAPSASGGNASLTVLMEKAYGLPLGSMKVVADQSGAGVISGAEQGIIVSPAFSCVLQDRGLKTAFSFVKPMESSYPAPLNESIGLPDTDFWASTTWVKQHPALVKNVQAALTEAINWVNSPSNLNAWVKAMRAGSLNNTSLSDSQYTSCLKSVQGLFNPTFSAADAQKWNKMVKDMNVLPNGLPPSSTWIAAGVPSEN